MRTRALPFAVAIVHGRKGGEIMLALKDARGVDHPRFIERIWVVMHIAIFEGRADFRAEKRVAIGLGHGVETRVEIHVDFFGIKNAYGGREQAIDGAP